MGVLRQSWTLTRKNILIAFNRHLFSTIVRAFILPVAFMIFLSYARNLFIPPSNYGVGSPHPIRTLAEGLNAASGGRNTLAFVNNGLVNGDIDRVIETVSQQAPGTTIVQRLTSESELLSVCKSTLRGTTTCYGAVVFISSPTEGIGEIWNYTLRADGAFGEDIDVTKTTNDAEIYLLPLQRAVDYAIANLNTTIDQSALPQTVLEYPYTSITQAQRNTDIRVDYQGAIINILGVAFLIGMVGVTYHLTGFIASERELGMSQLLEAMMPNLRRWQPQFARILSYHIAFDILYIPGWVVMGAVLGVGVFAQTSRAIVVIYHLLAGLSLTSFSILGASFFKKAQLSGITLAIATLLLGVLAQVIDETNSGTVAILSLLFVPCNYVFFIVFMARYERQKLATDLVRGAPDNPWSLPGIALWVFLVIQIFLYPLLGAAVERYLYGTASKGRAVVGRGLAHNADSANEPNTFDTVQLENFTKHYRPNWFRRRAAPLTKTPKATVVAVNNLTLSARKGQICVLLGANGSGKSTTLDAIAGLSTVTSGTITVDGTGGLGIAPQKNVLWDELTVEEHIRIFNHLKSTGERGSQDALRKLISAIDLDRKIGAKAKTLSGGQKRKLQLGMMFTGGSAVCCVDEVSSGLDPISRRKIWNILLAERGARTIILTTHFLDEADLLADHIAILSKGTLRASGSSVELKDKLGGGYRIHLQTGPGHELAPDIDGITKLATFGQTMYTAATSKQAAQIIKRLEVKGLTDYQLSGPTIEDVFLQLADEIHAESSTSLNRDTSSQDTEKNDEQPSTRLTTIPTNADPGLELHTGRNIGFFRQAWVLFRKRFTILHRNYLPYTAALVVPIVAAGLVTLLLKGYHGAGCSPDQQVSLSNVEGLATQTQGYDILVGPSSRFSNATLTSLFGPLIPGVIPLLNQSEIQQHLLMVDTLTQFNDYINQNFANVTPSGFFVDGAQTTLVWKGNGDIFNGVFGQNIMDVMLTNISIGTQYSSFDIPFAPSTGKSLQLVVYYGLAMAAYPGFFSLYPTVERTRNIRGLEYSNGVRSLPLWLAYLTFDFLIVLVSSALSVIIFAAASSAFYHVGYLFIIFALFGLASILLSYVVSLFARTQLSAYAFAAAGQAVLFLIYLIGYLCTLTYAPVNKIDSYLLIVHFTISLVTPMGSLIRALFVALNIFSTTCSGMELASNPGGILQYGGPILYLIVQVFVLFAILLWYDSGSVVAWWRRRFGKAPSVTSETDISTDEEIAEELVRVSSSNDGLRVLNLTKSFGPVTAVENLTFGIKRGEVFALLGPNGAGKSTTISLIRGDIQPSKNGGTIFVENIEINRHRANGRSHLGVCPQFDGK
jgi:ATP-binding cassette subfamily A (ABC1) protein 3